MKRQIILLIAVQFWKNSFRLKSLYGILIVMVIMISYAAYSGWKTYSTQNGIREHYQQEARESWENNPDKHPHRMAHYGSFAFRMKHPLSMFDFGLESFTGNAIFLEAHKQNTVNFSEASFSTGLLRFGEISMAMLMQVVLPLMIFFLGFASVASERENGTLKIILVQGAGWKNVLVGKSVGLMALALIVFIPVTVITLTLLLTTSDNAFTIDVFMRYACLMLTYLLFLFVLSIIAVLISSVSSSSKNALMILLALWLFMIVLLPKTTQVLGSYFYPSPSKIEFDTAVEQDIIRRGDSHNPDDPHYKALKDSVLLAHHVDSVEQLPFNYSGFQMREGERISAQIYNYHFKKLLNDYRRQNRISKVSAFFNPYQAIRNISMSLAGTDFESYVTFQQEAEDYRYQLAQTMNELQMKLISNKKPGPNDKPYTISQDHWKSLPDFKPQFHGIGTALRSEAWALISLLGWSVLSILLIGRVAKKAKAI
jgi:ABC-2 type transport system permease protein